MPLADFECDERGCDSKDVEPRFTQALKDIPKHRHTGQRDNLSQPRFYCRKHARRHPAVSPTGGEHIVPIARIHKSWEIVDGRMIPLRGGDVYGAKTA